jgi:hypothetical protein
LNINANCLSLKDFPTEFVIRGCNLDDLCQLDYRYNLLGHMLLPFNSEIFFQDFPPVFLELGPFPHFLLLNLNLFELLYILMYLQHP